MNFGMENWVTVLINLGLVGWVYKVLRDQNKHQKDIFEIKIKYLEDQIENLVNTGLEWKNRFITLYNHYANYKGCKLREEGRCAAWLGYIKKVQKEEQEWREEVKNLKKNNS